MDIWTILDMPLAQGFRELLGKSINNCPFQEVRRRLMSTIKLQAYTRSYLTRKHCKQAERESFDRLFPKEDPRDDNITCALVAKLLFFYDQKNDLNRLVCYLN